MTNILIMKKKNYISPCMMQVEWHLEAFCLAASGSEGSEGPEVGSGVSPDPWKEGNTNWW